MAATVPQLLRNTAYIFWMSVVVSFFSLVLYRSTVVSPVWFDELVLKALIFGFPVWLYAIVSKRHSSFFGLEASRFWPGAINGLAIGGILGFVAMIAYSLREAKMVPGLFQSIRFWQEFGLAFATAWWESLFFYGLILPVLREKVGEEVRALLLTTGIFALFHLPNLVLKVGWVPAFPPLLLLGVFAFGQGIIFLRTKSISTVVVSHAFWGMALLVYGR